MHSSMALRAARSPSMLPAPRSVLLAAVASEGAPMSLRDLRGAAAAARGERAPARPGYSRDVRGRPLLSHRRRAVCAHSRGSADGRRHTVTVRCCPTADAASASPRECQWPCRCAHSVSSAKMNRRRQAAGGRRPMSLPHMLTHPLGLPRGRTSRRGERARATTCATFSPCPRRASRAALLSHAAEY